MGLNLIIKKCHFLKKKIEYLGYVISHNQITMSERHTQAIKTFPLPRNIHEMQSFLGLTNYFRKFIKNYARKANPLYNLLKKNVKWEIDEDAIQAFHTLKEELTSYPILRVYNPILPTELHTDASSKGLRAILFQKQKDKNNWAPIAFYSQPLIKPKLITIALNLKC